MLGKTGVEVPCLGFGANKLNDPLILRGAYRWGVTYWDTASYYLGGNSERTIGTFLAKSPGARKDIFLASKASGAKSVEEMEKLLQGSLERLNTSYIDLYHVHSFGDHSVLKLTDELRAWAESAKERKRIRFFGLSTHKNTPENLMAASKTDWIDVVMMSYNFRLMQDPKVNEAVEACYQAGIGLVAMKVIALGVEERKLMEEGVKKGESEADRKFFNHFLERGYTEGQAKIKYVLEDKRISTACVGLGNVALLTSNVAAALDRTKLTRADRRTFSRFARATRAGYCAGCAKNCDAALPDAPYVGNVMRYLMYYNSYGDRERGREMFARIPDRIRARLPHLDYRPAELQCPQGMPIGRLVAEAVSKLS
jgi:aryl-alcohol dehydrogenase-like predicted oxidoreductase